MSAASSDRSPRDPSSEMGDPSALRLLTQLVAIAPTNLEDPAHGRWEKPNYPRAADAIVAAARSAGLSTRIYDPLVAGDRPDEWHGIPRPNVLVDLDVGARETVLILAHYDVVPVPVEQRARWKSPPHTLTARRDGRLYARGANDDLGSGIVGALTAMRHLAAADDLVRNVRLLACCDEETGGEGGIEAIRAHDARLAEGDPARILTGDVALIPDGSPEATGGSSGIAFLEASTGRTVPLAESVAFGESLVDLHATASSWRSVYRSPDWPDRNAPEPVITGRATVTQFDVTDVALHPSRVGLLVGHAETDAANQIARAVTLVFGGPAVELNHLTERLRPLVAPPFRLDPAGASSVSVPPGTLALQVIGTASHGGYPHRGHNPVPAALELLAAASRGGLVDPTAPGAATFTVDVRLIPEMELEDGLSRILTEARGNARRISPSATIVAPPARCRPGYAIPIDHPAVVKLERILRATFGAHGVRGEYGGTDASALRGLKTPKGDPLPALVFGSMDPSANIHDAEESADPRLIGGVVTAIEQFVREP